MEVEYKLTLDDVIACARFHMKHGPRVKRQAAARGFALGVVSVCGGLLLLSVLLAKLPAALWYSGWCFGILTGLFLFLFALLVSQKRFVVSNTIRAFDNPQTRWFLAWRRLRIDADGFEMNSDSQLSRNSWSIVWRIETTEDHAFFYTTLQQAHIVPRRAFPDQQAFESFVARASEYQKKHSLAPTSDGILDALPASSMDITNRPHS